MLRKKVVASSPKSEYNENNEFLFMVAEMDFIREKIKEKPIDKKTVLTKIGLSILCGIIFALSACAVMHTMWSKWKHTQEQETLAANSTENEEGMPELENAAETQKMQIPQDLSVTISDYQNLQNELYAIGNEASKSLVAVTGAANETDWINHAYETDGKGFGIIVSSDANYLYVLSEKKAVSDASKVKVVFVDETSAEATVLKSDGNTGMVILTVQKNKLERNTQKAIAVAKLGSSYAIENGMIVIALGSSSGAKDSIRTGNIISAEHETMVADKNYSVFTTDIAVGGEGSGIFLNTNGEVVGMAIQQFNHSQDMHMLSAVAISEISDIINTLSEGKDVPYLGLYISTVTDEISKTYDIPKGVFIKEVATDSPAMQAGLQSGDVLVKINGEYVSTDVHYSSKIAELLPGTMCEVMVKRQNGNAYYDVTCEVEIGVLH
uniref:S1C family serine protease n=1 Tax=Agathobacter sp. TaxID=2021311 RepID=UPI00405784BD